MEKQTSKLELAVTCEDHHSTVRAFVRAVDEIFVLNQHSWSTFSDVVSLCRHTLMRYQPGVEDQYMETVARMTKEAVRATPKAFAILFNHFVINQRFEDILGPVYMELGSKWKKAGLGQYFTPWEVCLCVAMLFHGSKPTKENPISVNEPCIGSGAMLLAARAAIAKEHGREALRWFHVSGQDIDPLCVEMSEVQLALTDDRFLADFMLASKMELYL